MEMYKMEVGIYIPRDVWTDIWTMISVCKLEVGALMSCSIDKDNGMITVDEIFIPSQEVTGGTCDFDKNQDEGLYGTDDILTEALMRDVHVPINGWVHSHVNMNTNFSSIDDDNIEKWLDYNNDYYVSICVNKKKEITGRVDMLVDTPFTSEPEHVTIDDVNVMVEEWYSPKVMDWLNTEGVIREKKFTYKKKGKSKVTTVTYNNVELTSSNKREVLEWDGVQAQSMTDKQIDAYWDKHNYSEEDYDEYIESFVEMYSQFR